MVVRDLPTLGQIIHTRRATMWQTMLKSVCSRATSSRFIAFGVVSFGNKSRQAKVLKLNDTRTFRRYGGTYIRHLSTQDRLKFLCLETIKNILSIHDY